MIRGQYSNEAAQGLVEVLRALRDWVKGLFEEKERVPHPYEDWNAVLDFVLDVIRDSSGMEFLRVWRVGDWDQLDKDWPEFGKYIDQMNAVRSLSRPI